MSQKGYLEPRLLLYAFLPGKCDADSRGLSSIAFEFFRFFFFFFGAEVYAVHISFSATQIFYFYCSHPWLSLTSEGSEVSQLMSNLLAVQTARTILHKTLFGILAHWVLAWLLRLRSPDETEYYRTGEHTNHKGSPKTSLFLCVCMRTHTHNRSKLLLSLIIIELAYREEVCLHRLEILVCPQAFDQQGEQRKEKWSQIKVNRREDSLFLSVTSVWSDPVNQHLQAQRWLLTRLIHNQSCLSRLPSHRLQ